PYRLITYGEPLLSQLFGEFPHTAPYPLIVFLRAPRHLVAKQLLHRDRYGRIFLFDPRSPLDRFSLFLDALALQEISKLTSSGCYCWSTNASNLREGAYTASPEVIRLDGRVQPALLLVQSRQKEVQFSVVLLVWMSALCQAVRTPARTRLLEWHIALRCK